MINPLTIPNIAKSENRLNPIESIDMVIKVEITIKNAFTMLFAAMVLERDLISLYSCNMT